ncbi:polysaccharide pyruvyl transferase family protein [Geomonas azotofigens]|uniref:polysaccharide pyruvyl transferase family protein n=1 Tax=Geomonas azotofigens TaxID=2843196 RepID=UPI001C119F92|nr:polysaccharide pyruvyl transferase family protein [Geomonas azotofigens]MBU5612552.1 polysaccharide pyruvyl transferase family protein [Geomonas azotofigens]
MNTISIFDTSISDYNLGNEIIMESVYGHMREVFPEAFFFKLPYMEITRHTRSCIQQSDLLVFGGTNSLSSRMEQYKQWDVNLRKSAYVKNVVLMGLGWWQYQEKESLYTKVLLKRVLSGKWLHSVRDSYTEAKLRILGFDNVVNTGCPTLWHLTPEHCREIRTGMGDTVVSTLTDYSQNPELDRRMLEVLSQCYRRVLVWLQGVGDRDYLAALGVAGVEVIPPYLQAFDGALADPAVDYVGTRLHAGIRSLQKGRRSLIVGVDNRAAEMRKDFDLPVLERSALDQLESRIRTPHRTQIRIPLENVTRWKGQFSSVQPA